MPNLNAPCPTCAKTATTWYECLRCRAVGCNACWFKSGSKCPHCGNSGKKNAKKP